MCFDPSDRIYDLRWVICQASKIFAGSLHRSIPGFRATKGRFESLHAALNFVRDEDVAKLQALAPVRSCLRLPCNAVAVRGETVAADDRDRSAGPINADQRHMLVGKPRKHIKLIFDSAPSQVFDRAVKSTLRHGRGTT